MNEENVNGEPDVTYDRDIFTEQMENAKSLSNTLHNVSNSIIRIPFQSNIIVNGTTNSGKSTFISNIFSKEYWSFDNVMSNVYVIAKIEDQSVFDVLKANCEEKGIRVHFYQEIDNFNKIMNDVESNSVIIIDDFMVNAVRDKNLMSQLTDLFNVYTHHKNLITIVTLHNLFVDGFRTVRLNSQFLFLFSTPVDTSSIQRFFEQLDPDNSQWLFQAYKKTLNHPQFGFMGIAVSKNLKHTYFAGFEGEIVNVDEATFQNYSKTYTNLGQL